MHILVITLEIILIATLGFLGNLIASYFNYSSNLSIIWIAVILVVLVLIPTTWFRLHIEKGNKIVLKRPSISIPQEIKFTLSTSAIQKNLYLLFAILLNSVLYGVFVAYASRLSVDLSEVFFYPLPFNFMLDGYRGFNIYPHEVIGVFMISAASVVVWRRIASIAGLVFCIVSTLCFSIIHLSFYPFQSITSTMIGTPIAGFLLTILLLGVRPVFTKFSKFIIDFWAGKILKED